MEPEMVAGLFGLGGALVGAAVSTGAVIWQQRKIAREAERVHLLGLAEAAANEVIQLSYELEDHFAEGVPDRNGSPRWNWLSRVRELNRALEQQALRFADPEVRHLVEWIHAEILRDPEGVAEENESDWPTARYHFMCTDLRNVMGTVLRRKPFPRGVWRNYPGA